MKVVLARKIHLVPPPPEAGRIQNAKLNSREDRTKQRFALIWMLRNDNEVCSNAQNTKPIWNATLKQQ